MRIHFIDNFSYGDHHMKFNAGLLASLLETGEDVVYWSSVSSRENVFRYLTDTDTSNIKTKRTVVFHGDRGARRYLRTLLNSIFNGLDLFFVKKDDVIIFNSNPYLLFPVFNFLCRVLHKKVVICCHGELDAFSRKPEERGKMGKIIYRIITNNPQIKIAEHLRFAVLADYIKEDLRDVLPHNFSSHFVSFDHPFIFETHIPVKSIAVEKFTAGTISNINRPRGEAFLNVVKSLKKEYTKKHIQAIGRIIDYAIAEKLRNEGVEVTGFLSRDEYDKKVQSLDYVLFLYPVSTYRFGVSGAVFDALNYNKPVIGLSNGYFRYVENKFGKIGILCDTEQEMADVLSGLSSHALGVDVNFAELKNAFSPETVSRQLMNILRSL